MTDSLFVVILLCIALLIYIGLLHKLNKKYQALTKSTRAEYVATLEQKLGVQDIYSEDVETHPDAAVWVIEESMVAGLDLLLFEGQTLVIRGNSVVTHCTIEVMKKGSSSRLQIGSDSI